VDRMACAWLIRRHVDPAAKFLFIPANQKDLPAGGEPFDIPGVQFSHHGGHCSFHALLKEHKLTDPVPIRVAAYGQGRVQRGLAAPLGLPLALQPPHPNPSPHRAQGRGSDETGSTVKPPRASYRC
jgi:hypothetical protein